MAQQVGSSSFFNARTRPTARTELYVARYFGILRSIITKYTSACFNKTLYICLFLSLLLFIAFHLLCC